MGDLGHLDQVSNRLHEVLDEARGSQKTANANLLELQNSCVKSRLPRVARLMVYAYTGFDAAQLKGAEIQRFLDNISNPDFHRQLQAQQLGPEQAEMQQHLRSLMTVSQACSALKRSIPMTWLSDCPRDFGPIGGASGACAYADDPKECWISPSPVSPLLNTCPWC